MLRYSQKRTYYLQPSQQRTDLSDEEVALLERKMGSDKKYTQKQMFREEIESPFRKTRLFLVPALAASAALGAFISGTRLIAASTGVTGYDVGETAQNLLINVASVVGLTLFYLNDKRARDSDLERIARAGTLSTLQIRLQSESGKEVLFPLKTFRKNRRLAIVVGGPSAVAEAREMATQGQEALTEVGAIVIPVELKELRDENSPPPSYVSGSGWILPCLAVPVREADWMQWLETGDTVHVHACTVCCRDISGVIHDMNDMNATSPVCRVEPGPGAGARSGKGVHYLRREERLYQKTPGGRARVAGVLWLSASGVDNFAVACLLQLRQRQTCLVTCRADMPESTSLVLIRARFSSFPLHSSFRLPCTFWNPSPSSLCPCHI